MDAGVHLPLIDFSGGGFSYRRLAETVDAARACGFGAVSANDHFLFSRPWLDGLTALAAVIERSGGMKLVTTVALAALRAGAIGQGAVGTGRAVRWPGDRRCRPGFVQGRLRRGGRAVRAAVAALRRHAPADQGHAPADNCGQRRRAGRGLLPPPRQGRGIPVWIGSWGSRAGMRRVARAGDGWLASAYNTTPEAFTAAREVLCGELDSQHRPSGDFPNALVTMWAWITGSRPEADRVLSEIIAPLVRRDPAELRGRICVGSAAECAELLSRYARAGCQRVHFWPVGDEPRQIELIAGEVMPQVSR